MISYLMHTSRRMLSTCPTSNFITLNNRPIVQKDGNITTGSLKLHYWEWNGQKPTILFCHAASFHGRCYDRIINEALSGFHVISLDFRGHGRSQQHPAPYRFPWFGEDVFQFIEQLNLSKNNLIGIGHSVGGYALTYAAAKATKRLFHTLVLLDPVIFSPSLYEDLDTTSVGIDAILRRKSQWLSVEEMISRLEQRAPFSRWPKDALRNYCTYAIDDNNKLVCEPSCESSIYKSSSLTETNIYPSIENSKFIQDILVHVVRACTEASTSPFDSSPTNPDLVKWFKNGHDRVWQNSTHFYPMEQPELVIDLLKEILKENLRSHL